MNRGMFFIVIMCAITFIVPPTTQMRAQSDETDEIGDLKEQLTSDGLTAYHAGQLDSAAFLFNAAIELDSAYAISWHGLGLVHQQRQEYDSAVLCFRRALNLGSPSIYTRTLLADCLYRLGEYREAESTAREAMHLDPHAISASITLARILRWTDRESEVPGVLNEAAKHAEDRRDSIEIADAFVWHERPAEGARLFAAVCRTDSSSSTLWSLARAGSQAHDCHGVITTVQALVRLYGTHPQLERALVLAAHECGETSLERNVRAVHADQDWTEDFDAVMVRGLCAMGRYSEALTLCYRFLHDHPGFAPAQMLAANAQMLMGSSIRAAFEVTGIADQDSAAVIRIGDEYEWIADPRAYSHYVVRTTLTDTTFAPPAEHIDYYDPRTGLRLPARGKGYVRNSITKSESLDMGTTISYDLVDDAGTPIGTLTVFIYRAPHAARGPWFVLDRNGKRIWDTTGGPGHMWRMTEPTPEFLSEYWRARRDIIEYRKVSTLSMESRFIVSMKRKLAALYCSYHTVGNERNDYNALYLFTMSDRYIKVRVTMPWSPTASLESPASQLFKDMVGGTEE